MCKKKGAMVTCGTVAKMESAAENTYYKLPANQPLSYDWAGLSEQRMALMVASQFPI